jgi:hypothetical protein
MINKGSNTSIDTLPRQRSGGRFGILVCLCVLGGILICVLGGLWIYGVFQNAPPEAPCLPYLSHHAALAEVVRLRARAEIMADRFKALQEIDAKYKPIAKYIAGRMRRANELFKSQRYDAAYSVYMRLLMEFDNVPPEHGTSQPAKPPTTNPAGKPTTRQRGEITSGDKLLKTG